MRTATVTRFGGPEVLILVEQPDPALGPGQVVVAVEVADTLWLETVVRSGAGQDCWPMRPPYVPGNEGGSGGPRRCGRPCGQAEPGTGAEARRSRRLRAAGLDRAGPVGSQPSMRRRPNAAGSW
ncbi:MAG: hypothetical protein ACRDRI_00935 [Pseudonocardiaceae bacterium]